MSEPSKGEPDAARDDDNVPNVTEVLSMKTSVSGHRVVYDFEINRTDMADESHC